MEESSIRLFELLHQSGTQPF
jgi:hypothetical protein